ncbi:hypothetical protein Dimus_028578 [Dionaea muscipula]
MARRGRPKKKGGLPRDDPAARVSVAGSGGAKGAKDRLDVLSIRDVEERSGGLLGSDAQIEMWADDEEELVDAAIAVDSKLGTPYLQAFQRGIERGESSRTEDSPMAGNRDLRKGWGHRHVQCMRKRKSRQEWRPKVVCGDDLVAGGLARQNDQPKKSNQGDASRAMNDGWIPAKKGGSGLCGDKGICRPDSRQIGSGSRFLVLDEEEDLGDVQCPSEITAVVNKQLGDVLLPFNFPIT